MLNLLRQLFGRKSRPVTNNRRTRLAIESLEDRNVPAGLVPGGIVSGAIAQSGEFDSWTYNGAVGDKIQIITTSTASQSGFHAYTRVYAPSDTPVAGFWADDNVELTLEEAGVYTFEVRDNNDVETGSYTIGLESLKPISPDPGAMVYGGIVSGEIGARNEKDQWTFSGNAGDKIELITTDTATQSGFFAYADVYAPSGTRVAGFWANDNVELTLEETGTYMIQVRDNNHVETGSYTIGLEGLKPISPLPSSLVKGGIVSGAIGERTEKDQWTFAGTKDDIIELISTSTASTAGFHAYMDVYAPSGTRVAGFWADDNVELTLGETGTYMIQVRDNNYVETGSYTIGFEGLKPISPSPSTISKGGIVSGEIKTRTEKDQWTFSGKPGDMIQLISTSTATLDGFHAYVDVYAPSGTRVAGFWANDNVELTLGETGTYMIQVRDNNYVETGKYTIGFESVKPFSPDSKALQPKVKSTSKIDRATEKDQWRIKAPAGRSLTLTLSGTAIQSGFAVYANIYAPSGARVGGMWAGTETFTLPGGGVYIIQVSDANLLKRGSYSLKARFV